MAPVKPRGPYRVGLPSKRGCWTCRDRKISCDQGRPECQNCVSTSRNCQGYGLRLSWPAPGSRRSIEHSMLTRTNAVWDASKTSHFLNTSMVNVELLYMKGPDILGKLPIHNMCIFPLSNLANAQPNMSDGHHLVTFFMTKVVASLIPIATDGYNLSKFLFQLSFSDDSPASMAVLQAILSLASVYRHGNAEESLRLKVASLGSLSASMNKQNIGTREIYQHVAVGMLICAFEIFLPSETSFQWPLYVSGAKSMLHEICDGGHPKLEEADLLILWVHYHDILAKFTAKHWNTQSAEKSSISKVQGMASSLASVAKNQVLGIFGCSLEMINLIARMSEIKLYGKLPEELPYTERRILHSIENDLITIKQDITSLVGTNPAKDVDYGSKMSQLYRLAGLIYFERVLKASSTDLRVAGWSDEAFDIIRQLRICDRPFPMFFIACEAYTDTKREIILSLLERTQKVSGHRSMCVVQKMIELMWVQLDLVSDLGADLGGTRYVDVLNAVISSIKYLPTLA